VTWNQETQIANWYATAPDGAVCSSTRYGLAEIGMATGDRMIPRRGVRFVRKLLGTLLRVPRIAPTDRWKPADPAQATALVERWGREAVCAWARRHAGRQIADSEIALDFIVDSSPRVK
jgi:hypothetical protein